MGVFYVGNKVKNSVSTRELKTATFFANDLADRETTVTYADGKSLYKYKLDGGLPEKVTELEDDIYSIQTVPFTTDIYIQTLKKGPSKTSDMGDEWKGWLLKAGSSVPDLLYDNKITGNTTLDPGAVGKKLKLATVGEYIYPEKAGSGVNIMSDTLDGSSPKKIGFLRRPILRVQTCEVEDNCYDQVFPSGFIPSYTGEYLLNEPPGGGGLGEPGVVISRDGTKVYPIDFYWYISNAVWISGNQLLTSDQKGKKLFTFKPDGSFATEDAPYLNGEFRQNWVSPSRKYLIINDSSNSKLDLLDLTNKSIMVVDSLDQNSVPKGEAMPAYLGVLGWNKNSDKILYGLFVGSPNSGTNRSESSYKREIKVFDLATKKSYKIADLKPDNDMWLDFRLFTFQ